jgi:Protein of unknown function (DUF664)
VERSSAGGREAGHLRGRDWRLHIFLALHFDECQALGMIDSFAKEYLRDELKWARVSLAGKVDGLSEYDVRRPLTKTGTNLLGLVKHLTLSEARYFGSVFDRPYPGPETNRHLGHADILREQLDGALGSDPTPSSAQEDAGWARHRAMIDKAAQAVRN